MVRNFRLDPVIPGGTGPGRVEGKLSTTRCGAPKGERPRNKGRGCSR